MFPASPSSVQLQEITAGTFPIQQAQIRLRSGIGSIKRFFRSNRAFIVVVFYLQSEKYRRWFPSTNWATNWRSETQLALERSWRKIDSILRRVTAASNMFRGKSSCERADGTISNCLRIRLLENGPEENKTTQILEDTRHVFLFLFTDETPLVERGFCLWVWCNWFRFKRDQVYNWFWHNNSFIYVSKYTQTADPHEIRSQASIISRQHPRGTINSPPGRGAHLLMNNPAPFAPYGQKVR